MKSKKIQLVRLYKDGCFKGFSIAMDGQPAGDVLESMITSQPDAPVEITVKFALGLDGQDPVESSIRIDL